MARVKGNTVEFFQVDAFTSEMFKGNPAAVCIPEEKLPDSICQAIAAEMNLSETAFTHSVERLKDDIPRFGLRWFTPKTEVDLCGHATLATAKVIFQEIGVDSEVLAFDTRSGALFAHREGTAVRLDFPANPSGPADAPAGILKALGVGSPKDVEFSPTSYKLVVELENEIEVMQARPDFKAMVEAENELGVKGVIITSRGGLLQDSMPGPDFVSRFFAPWYGIDEDPVTGAAHTVLAPYWMKRLKKKVMEAHQLSERGGQMTVKVDDEGGRVHMIGEAVVVLDGTIRLG
jgi:PhzF family phenazine biosynthesis protein